MVKIRLLRAGAKKRPYYRVIAIDERRKRDGRALEFLGSYDPIAVPAKIKLETERIDHWRQNGAQLSPAVKALLKRAARQPATPTAASPEPAPAAAETA